jgi:hypothetical protein
MSDTPPRFRDVDDAYGQGRIRADFIPFARMTPGQQAEHLVYGHGFDRNYFWESGYESETLVRNPTNEQIVEYFTADGELRAKWHDDDHEDDYTYGGTLMHTHNKEN